MKLAEECRNCILKRAKGIVQRAEASQEIIDEVGRAIDQVIRTQDSWIDGGLAPAQLGSTRQHILKQHHLHDTYTKERDMGMQIGKAVYETYQGKLDLVDALILAAIGNGLEFDVAGNYQEQHYIMEEFELLRTNNQLNEQARNIGGLLARIGAGKVVYLLDNVGEHYCDAILIEKLLEYKFEVHVLAKESPVLNDITVKELDNLPQVVQVWSSGHDDVGTFYARLPSKVREVIDTADFIIAKGMANFETLSRRVFEQPVAFLLRAKCEPVAQTIGVDKLDYILHLQPPETPWVS